MVREGEAAYGSEWGAICAVAEMLGPAAKTVRKWVRRAEVDAGERPGLKPEERERLKQLERENFELRRANEILRSASLFFATIGLASKCRAELSRWRSRFRPDHADGHSPAVATIRLAPDARQIGRPGGGTQVIEGDTLLG